MKSIALFFVVFILTVQTAWAGRAKIDTVARDPYASALVMDAETGKVLFSDHPDTPVFPASVIKLMNLLVILDRIDQGTLKLEDMVQVTTEAAKTGGSQVYLDPKERFTVEDLLYALAVQSANDAAVALAVHIAGSKEGFVALMNQKAADWDEEHPHLLRPWSASVGGATTGRHDGDRPRPPLPGPGQPSGGPQIHRHQGTGFRDNTFIMRNHNHLLGQIDGCDGFKTGYYQAAGFSIAVTARKGGVRIISIVMGSKDRKVRDAKASELLGKGFAMVPPKPEPAVAVSKPAPPAATPVQNAAPAPPAAVPAGSGKTGRLFRAAVGDLFSGVGDRGCSLRPAGFFLCSENVPEDNLHRLFFPARLSRECRVGLHPGLPPRRLGVYPSFRAMRAAMTIGSHTPAKGGA